MCASVLQLCVETADCWHILQTQTLPLQAQNTLCATVWDTGDKDKTVIWLNSHLKRRGISVEWIKWD